MATFLDDCLPPEGFFETRDALFELINAYVKPRGYAFITQRLIHGPSGFLRVFFVCDGSRRPPSSPDQDRQRKTITRMTNCPFLVLAKEFSKGWTLKHRQDHRFATHNHEPSLHPTTHPDNKSVYPWSLIKLCISLYRAGSCTKHYGRLRSSDNYSGKTLFRRLFVQVLLHGFTGFYVYICINWILKLFFFFKNFYSHWRLIRDGAPL